MEEDPYRVLLLFHDELEAVELLPFASRSSGRLFDASSSGSIQGEVQLLDFMNTVGIDSIVRLEEQAPAWSRVFCRFPPQAVLSRIKEQFARKTLVELKILDGAPLDQNDQWFLQPFEHVTLGSSSIAAVEGLKLLPP